MSGTVAERRDPSFKVRSSREEIPHAQGKRNPSKMVGVATGHHFNRVFFKTKVRLNQFGRGVALSDTRTNKSSRIFRFE